MDHSSLCEANNSKKKWFERFHDRNFSLVDDPCSGVVKKFEDKKFQILLVRKKPCQTQEELSTINKVTKENKNPSV